MMTSPPDIRNIAQLGRREGGRGYRRHLTYTIPSVMSDGTPVESMEVLCGKDLHAEGGISYPPVMPYNASYVRNVEGLVVAVDEIIDCPTCLRIYQKQMKNKKLPLTSSYQVQVQEAPFCPGAFIAVVSLN